MSRRTKPFYHFTSRLWWRFIEKEGIRHGEVPIGGGLTLDHPNLTTDPDPANQGWACSSGEVTWINGRKIVWVGNKRAVRIRVQLEGLAVAHHAAGQYLQGHPAAQRDAGLGHHPLPPRPTSRRIRSSPSVNRRFALAFARRADDTEAH